MKILLVDDQRLFANSLRVYLEKVLPDFEQILVAYSGAEAVAAIEREKPEIALIDIFMPDMNGIEIVRYVQKRSPSTRMLMLTNFDDHDFVFEAMNHGASGYLLKEEIDEQQLILAIKNAMSGVMSISPHALRRLLASQPAEAADGEAAGPGQEPPGWFVLMSPKERQILRLLVEGLTNEEIAERVYLSQQTVKNYLSGIYSRMGVRNRTEAVRVAWKHLSGQ